MTLSNIVNTNGNVTADIVASCTATNASFTLQVSDGCLAATATLNVAVTATAPVVITAQPVNQTVCIGGSATFTVAATGATGYQWRKGGLNINGATASSYTINPVATGDAGSYDVVITGTCDTVTSGAASLTVNPTTDITTHPVSQTKTVGQSVIFSVAATGANLTYQWRKNSANITDATSSSYTIASVAAGDAGSYDVIVSGACGSQTSTAATLTINCVSSLTVNNTGGGTDASPGNGVCETAASNGICTLRAAIQEANALTACSPFTINFSVTGTISLTSALPNIIHPNLTISGPGANQLTVSGNNAVRVFTINPGNLNVTLSGLTVANGNIATAGSGLLNQNTGTTTITNCAFNNNTSGIGTFGGAIYHFSAGTLNVTGSTFNGNRAGAAGGAVYNNAAGTVNLTNCTFSGNTAGFGSAINSGGSGGTINLLNTTITGNTANGTGGGGSIRRTSGTVNLKNTLVAGNTATTNPDVDGTFVSQGNNLIGNTTGGTGFGGTDLLNVSALLGSLSNYGGTTSTIPLLPGSLAINAGTSTGAPGTDQRGIARVGSVDIGAFESRGFTLTIAGGDNQNTSGGSAFSAPLSVTVSSANSEPVNGGQVTFTPPGSGASCTLATNPAVIASGAASSTATANTTIGGPYAVSAAATGASSVNFSLTNTNSAPTFTPAAAISRQQGDAAGAAVTVGTVSDGQTAAGSLTVTQIAGGTATGITVASITNTGGTITAVVTADCTATPGTVRFQVSDGTLTGTGDLTVNVTASTPPTVANAGPDQTVCATTATLAANTPTVGTGAWSIISGTGGTVTTPSSPTSGFTGVAGNSYTLRWTITGTCATSTDDMAINLTANPTGATAGPDQPFCGTSVATLAANTPTVGTGAWTVVSGPSTLASQFSNTSSPTATFTPAGGTGTYTLRWTTSNSPCTSSTDDVVLTYNAVPTISLGANPSVLPGATSANLTYSATSGSPNQYSIDYDSTANTAGFVDVTNASLAASPIVLVVPNAAAAGTYNATLTVRNSATGCVSSSTPFTVTISSCPTSFTVNNTGDAADATPGNGVCATAGGVCTLRAAIEEANALTACSPMTITFSVNGTITLTTALPAIAHPNLTITGNGAANTIISGNNAVRGLSVTANNLTLALNSLTITNANSTTNGAALSFASNGGTLNLTDCVLSHNTTTAKGGGLYLTGTGATATLTNTTLNINTASSYGGGIEIESATLTLNGCTVSGNSGNGGGIALLFTASTLHANNSLFSNNATIDVLGGAIGVANGVPIVNVTGCTFTGNSGNGAMTTGGTITITNSTFSGNPTLGIFAFGGTTNIINSTFSGNSAPIGTAADIYITSTSIVNLKNTILANPLSGPSCNRAGTSTVNAENSLIEGSLSCVNGTNLNNLSSDPLLSALGSYGGATQTFALLPGSPAINAGTVTGAPASDQRGIARVGNVDIGAYESRGFTLAIAGGDNQSTAAGSAFASPLSVTVSSADGEPVNGGQVTFTPPGAGASCTLGTNPATISSGAASSTATANAIIGGPYNVAANANGATLINFSLTNTNSAPTFTPAAAISRQQGAAAGAAVTVGTVADGQTAAGSLVVTQIAGGTATGITVASITNTGGTITAVVTADCTATPGTVRFQVSDGSLTGTGDLTINIIDSTPPTAANAGPDQTVCATSATLAANTPSVGTGAWSIISGSGGSVTTPASPTSGFTGVAGTSYTLRWTITGACATSTDEVVITLTANPTTANAGPDQILCATSATLAANTPAVGTGAWSIVSGTGGSVTTPSSPTSAFTGTAGTTYTLRWTISNSPCTASTDDVVITLTANPTAATAGPDQTLCATSATLAANTPTIGTGAWSIVSGAGGTITTPSSPTSGFTGVAGTTYTLRWTISNLPCTASTDDVVITLTANPTTANAGPDQTLCATSATLAANTPAVGTGAWSIVSGTGGSVTTPSSPTSTFTGVAGTTYTLRWTISNSPCTASTDDVVITLTANPTAATAGPDQTLCATSATLAANTPSVGTGAWTIISGTGGTITTPSSPTSGFTGVAGTTYTLRWTISNAPCTASTDDVVITLTANPTTANAGPDQTLCATSATLAANTPAVGTGAWSLVSGAGGTVTTPSSPTSAFTGVAGTTYTLRWTVSNSPCTASTDDVVITLRANPTAATAGPDQTVCATSATLAANTPAVGTGAWSIVSGAGGTVTTPSSATSGFTGVAGTTYTLRWTISNSPCTASSDDVVITLTANPTAAAAGPDQAFCGTSAATLAANVPSVGTGAWSIVSGPSLLTSQFNSLTNSAATFTPAGGTGTYTLRWTISNSPCASSADDVVITYNAVPAITLGASPSVLPGATGANLPYTAPTGSPNQYSIDYNAAANTAGFADVTNATLTASPLILAVPGAAASGTYNATLTVRNSATGCVSGTTPFTVTISSCPTAFTVNNTGDGADAAPGNGVCETATGNGVCTLLAAIQEANALTACSPMTITITATGAITLGSTLPGIARSNLTISGPGADQLTVSGNNAVAVMQINAATANVTLSGLTIANGRITNSTGAGLQNFSNGTVTLNNLAFTNNQTITGGDGAALNHNGTGTLNVNGSTFSGNTSATAGGALAISDAGAVNLTNCTFTGNTALNGGGVYNSLGNLTLLNCTLSGNTGTGSAGGLGRAGGTVSLKNTLVAGNTAPSNPDVAGAFTSQGNNLIGNSTGGTGFGGTDLLNVNALLGTFGNYGGTTNTIPLLPGSPAINAGTATGAPASDQRGIARAGNVDIGAFESRGFTLGVAGGNNQSAVTGTAFAAPLSVTVSSADGEPVNGGQVTFTPPGSGPGCTLGTNPAAVAGGAASATATANGVIGGPYTVSANSNGATSINFSLTNTNSAPAFTPAAAISRQQGSAAAAAVTVGTVADSQTAAGSLTVTQIAGGTATGINVASILNTGGTISAVVTADCAATPGTVRFQVSDGSLTSTGDLTVSVTGNAAPAVTYGNVAVNGGASTTNSTATATDNGSITGYAVQSQGSYTGTISVDASGVVSIGNAAPVGAHTISIRATDNCGAFTDATFTLTVNNTAPAFTPAAAISRQQGSAAAAAVTIGLVADAQTAAGSLTVTQIAGGTATGINVTGITNADGTISAVVTADCGATPGTVRFQVSDGGLTGTGDFTVNVEANTAPSVTYANVSVNAGASTTNSTATATDNGSIAGYAIQSQGTYTGTISVNASGTVSIGNAAPVGSHTITVRATDNCGTTTDAQFTLNVGNNLPAITAAALSRQQGTAGTVGTIATVSDSDTPPGNLVVTATTVPAGITISSIVNNNGTITANIAAGCNATIGANSVVLTVTDSDNGTATANLTVTVSANAPPSVAYADAAVNAGGSTAHSITTATDNGSITGYAVQSQGSYTGTISVDASGVVSISNAAPVGAHMITIRTTDNCGATTDATFTLTVNNNAPAITAGAALTRQQGSAGSAGTIATVSDGETPIGSLVVTATTVPAGITVTSIINAAGTITATVAADCAATIGNHTVVLTVTDANGGTAAANLIVTVTANDAP
ncbi:MAG TPA: choice-of-anchor Q domain-containing protein, partial [Blastocatellia bacterium]